VHRKYVDPNKNVEHPGQNVLYFSCPFTNGRQTTLVTDHVECWQSTESQYTTATRSETQTFACGCLLFAALRGRQP